MRPEDLPLTGTVVLDFSQFLAGPVAALRLADLGARVIKVERPVSGEIGRTLAFAGRSLAGDTLSFHAMNRNKESVVADLKDPADLARVKALLARVDVLIENFRPGVMERIGLDYATVRELNPALVYASASGYGPTGPWTGRPGQDLLAQAVSGATWLAGMDRPVPIGLAIADHLMSCHLAQGVTALLLRQARTGRGGRVETSLLEGMLDLQSALLTRRDEGAGTAGAEREGQPHHGASGIHATLDGYVALAGVPLDELATLLERPDDAAGWCAPVRTLDELLASSEFAALEMVQEVDRAPADPGGETVTLATTRSPIRIDGQVLRHRRGAPRLGAQGALRDGVDPLERGRG